MKHYSALCDFFIGETFSDHAQASNVVNVCYRFFAINRETDLQNDSNDQTISTSHMKTSFQLDHDNRNFVALKECVENSAKLVIAELHGNVAMFTKLMLLSTLLRKFYNKFKELLQQKFQSILMTLSKHSENEDGLEALW